MSSNFELPKNIIFIVHGESEAIFIDELVKGFLAFVYEKLGLGYYKHNDDNPAIYIAKDFNNSYYNSFHTLHDTVPNMIKNTVSKINDSLEVKLEDLSVIYILDEDKDDDFNLIEKIKSEEIFVSLVEESLKEFEIPLKSCHLFTTKHSIEDAFIEYNPYGVNKSSKVAKSKSIFRKKINELNSSNTIEEFIEKIKINQDRSNLNDLFNLIYSWIKQLVE